VDPALVAVAGALSTVAVALYRELLRRATKGEADAAFWQEKYFNRVALSELDADEADS
jgi:Tfp pilus assembly protein PilE